MAIGLLEGQNDFTGVVIAAASEGDREVCAGWMDRGTNKKRRGHERDGKEELKER